MYYYTIMETQSLLTQQVRQGLPAQPAPSAYYPKKFAEFGTITKTPNEIKFDRIMKQYKNPYSKWHPSQGITGNKEVDTIKECITAYKKSVASGDDWRSINMKGLSSYKQFEEHCPGLLDKLPDDVIGGKRKNKTRNIRKSRNRKQSRKNAKR